MKDLKKEKLDIVIVGGQSNAEGYGRGEVSEEYIQDERILCLCDRAHPHFEKNQQGKDYLCLEYPSEVFVEIGDEPTDDKGKAGKLALFFARQYIENGLLKKGRKLLIVNAAVGGTGFARNEWGCDGILFKRLLSLTETVLSLCPENRLVAFLWHQGECDAFENAAWSVEKRYRTHYFNLRRQLEEIKSYFQAEKLPFICGGFTDEWYEKNRRACDAILSAMRDICEDIGGAFVCTEGLLSNNQKTGNGDDIHFCRESLHLLGENYFKAYRQLHGDDIP